MEGHCAPAAATVTDDHDLQPQILQCPSPAPINTDFIKFDGPNSPTWLHEILSDDGGYATLDPLVTSPQFARLLSGDNSARRYQCAPAGAATVIKLPPFPSESWDSIGGFDVGTETATYDGMHFSPPPPDFFDFENPFLKMPPEISQEDPQYTGLLSDVVNFDSALDFQDRPEAEAGKCRPEPEPNLADGKKKKKVRFWTKEEHMLFLIGVERYGKGNWKDIATKLVVTKASTQVASHAQKYYDYHQNPNPNLRQKNGKSGRAKSSIFDITTVDPHSKARLLHGHAPIVQPPSPPQQFTITNYYPPPHQPS